MEETPNAPSAGVGKLFMQGSYSKFYKTGCKQSVTIYLNNIIIKCLELLQGVPYIL